MIIDYANGMFLIFPGPGEYHKIDVIFEGGADYPGDLAIWTASPTRDAAIALRPWLASATFPAKQVLDKLLAAPVPYGLQVSPAASAPVPTPRVPVPTPGKGKVYIVQDHPRFDTSCAASYGEPVIVFEGPYLSDKGSFIHASEILNKFNSAVDYVLCIGDPLHLVLIGAVLRDYEHDYVKILRWDKQREGYIPYTLNLI